MIHCEVEDLDQNWVEDHDLSEWVEKSDYTRVLKMLCAEHFSVAYQKTLTKRMPLYMVQDDYSIFVAEQIKTSSEKKFRWDRLVTEDYSM